MEGLGRWNAYPLALRELERYPSVVPFMPKPVPLFALLLAAGVAACTTSALQTNSTDPGTDTDASTPTPEGGALSSNRTGTADCTKTALSTDGWTQIIGPDYVELSREGAIVELNWAITLDDALRGGPGVLENLWTLILGQRFTSGARTLSSRDFIAGPATDIASGTTGFIGLAGATVNGTSRPVVGITTDEASFRALFTDGDGLAAMHRYNDFPLSCGAIEGAWGTSSIFAGLSATTATGLTVTSSQLDITFAREGYRLDQVIRVDTRTERLLEDGTFTAGDHELVLTSSEGKVTTYDAGYVAINGGLALSLVNRQFMGQRDVLLRP